MIVPILTSIVAQMTTLAYARLHTARPPVRRSLDRLVTLRHMLDSNKDIRLIFVTAVITHAPKKKSCLQFNFILASWISR
ncbi:hypothetical protein GGI35DRAFT_56866 [Trichoderma velutinum]